jgi:hypothetical protein
LKCLEEMEQAREAKDREQVEEWAEEAAQAEAEADKVWEAVLRPDPEVIVFVPIAVKKRPISWGGPVMSNNAQSAEQK